MLCLDQNKDINNNNSNEINDQIDPRSYASGQILHGNKKFTANRWFDKTIQVIIGENGVWGVNFEHSIAEALPHAVMTDHIYKNMYNLIV